jgi:regulatory protein
LRSEQPEQSGPLTAAELKKIAIDLLSRRDHSRQELAQKLKQKGGLDDDIQQVLDWCGAENYQSESRYAALLVRSKINKGYGPLYLSQAAREQGISKELLSQTIETLEIDWFALALAQYQKKYLGKPVEDFHEKQKRMAYLQRRGFNGSQIQYALKPD